MGIRSDDDNNEKTIYHIAYMWIIVTVCSALHNNTVCFIFNFNIHIISVFLLFFYYTPAPMWLFFSSSSCWFWFKVFKKKLQSKIIFVFYKIALTHSICLIFHNLMLLLSFITRTLWHHAKKKYTWWIEILKLIYIFIA